MGRTISLREWWEDNGFQSFRAVLPNFNVPINHLLKIVKKQFLIQSVWGGTWDSVFLTSSRDAIIVVHDCPQVWQGFKEWN